MNTPVPGLMIWTMSSYAFLLAVNGEPVAWTDPHGAWIDWVTAPDANANLGTNAGANG